MRVLVRISNEAPVRLELDELNFVVAQVLEKVHDVEALGLDHLSY